MTFQGQGQSFTCREGLHLPVGEVQLGQRPEVGVLKESVWNHCEVLAKTDNIFHALVVKVDQLPDTFGQQHRGTVRPISKDGMQERNSGIGEIRGNSLSGRDFSSQQLCRFRV